VPEATPRFYRPTGSAFFQVARGCGLPRPLFVGRATTDDPRYHARVHAPTPGVAVYFHLFAGALRGHDGRRTFRLTPGEGVLFVDTDTALNLRFDSALAPRADMGVFFMDGGDTLLPLVRQVIAGAGRCFRPDTGRGSVLGRIFAWARPVQGHVELEISDGFAMVTAVLAALVASAGGGDNGLTTRARALLKSRGLAGASVAGIAAELGLSREHFSRSFRAATGESPAEYLDRLRCAEASRLLTGSEFSQTEIARRLGFARLGSFQRAFRRAAGCPPGDYRRLHRHW
jgi:AraC-like DNA-binding protein